MPADDWAVYRIDFSGNHFLVEKGLSEERAHELVREFEAHQHHQHYWAERLPDAGPDYIELLRASLAAGSSLAVSLRMLLHQGASPAELAAAVGHVRGVDAAEAQRLVRAAG